MAQDPQAGQGIARTIVVDIVVAAIIFAFGALVTWDSKRLGAGWGDEGPQAGYFPFYIGLLICISSAVVIAQSVLKLKSDARVFVEGGQLRQVLIILLPAVAYVLGVQYLGIYVPSAIFIALFMRLVGKYSWTRSIAVGAAVSVIAFMMFEIWFKIPLPKGPLEEMLGY